MATKKTNLIKINREWKQKEINLWERCPKTMGKINQQKQWFIPATLVREIQRAVGFVITSKQMDHKFVNTENGVDIVMSASVVVEVDWVGYSWYALSALRYSAIAKSWFGQPWRIVSVAIKDALKQCYAFFEGDYAEGDNAMEDIAEAQNVVDIMDDILWTTPQQQAAPAPKKEEPKKETPAPEKPKPEPVKETVVYTKEWFIEEILSYNEPVVDTATGIRLARLVIEKFSLQDNKEAKQLLIEVLNTLKERYETNLKAKEEAEAKAAAEKKAKEEAAAKKKAEEAEAKAKAAKEAEGISLDSIDSAIESVMPDAVVTEPVKEEVIETTAEETPEEVEQKPSAVPAEATKPEVKKNEAVNNNYTTLITEWLTANNETRNPQVMARCMNSLLETHGIEKGSEEFGKLKAAILSYGK